jgi:hypothetical protein
VTRSCSLLLERLRSIDSGQWFLCGALGLHKHSLKYSVPQLTVVFFQLQFNFNDLKSIISLLNYAQLGFPKFSVQTHWSQKTLQTGGFVIMNWKEVEKTCGNSRLQRQVGMKTVTQINSRGRRDGT